MTPDPSDEKEIFASTTEAPEVETPAPAQAAVAGEQEQEEPEAEANESGEPDGHEQAGDQAREPKRVSYGALKEEREWRKQLQADAERREKQWAEEKAQLYRMVEQLRAAPQAAPQVEEQPAGDPLAELVSDPETWARKRVEAATQEVAKREFTTRFAYSERFAVIEHGKETVEAAKAAIEQAVQAGSLNPKALEAELRASDDPVGLMVNWHKRNSILSEVGTDPAAYEAKLRAKIMAEMQGGTAPAGQIPTPAGTAAPNLPPPSLLRAQGNAGIAHSGSITEEDIFNSAPAFGKKRA